MDDWFVRGGGERVLCSLHGVWNTTNLTAVCLCMCILCMCLCIHGTRGDWRGCRPHHRTYFIDRWRDTLFSLVVAEGNFSECWLAQIIAYRKRVRKRLWIIKLQYSANEFLFNERELGRTCRAVLYRPCYLGVSYFEGVLFLGEIV
jgi:hypothetical protein